MTPRLLLMNEAKLIELLRHAHTSMVWAHHAIRRGRTLRVNLPDIEAARELQSATAHLVAAMERVSTLADQIEDTIATRDEG
jgi:hypothetical protein